MANTTVDFNVPSPYQTEQRRIEQQQKMAEMLQAQSMQPSERFSYNGIEARVPATAGLAKMLQGFTSIMAQQKGEEEQKALGEKYRTQSAGEAQDFISALRGTPAVPEKAVPESSFAPSGSDLTDTNVPRVPEGQPNAGNVVQPGYTVPGVAGTPADRNKALALAMQSINPMVQGAGGSILAEMLKGTETSFGKVDPAHYTQDSVKAFQAGGGKDYALLVPRVSEDTKARLAQSAQQWGALSADQQLKAQFEAAKLGISVQELMLNRARTANAGMETQFNTGTGIVPGMPQLPQIPQIPAVGAPQTPQGMPQGLPQTAQGMPQGAPRAAMPQTPQGMPQTAQPTGEVQPLINTVTPKERQILMVAQPQQSVAAQSALQNMERLSNVANELKNHPGMPDIVGKLNQYSTFDMSDKAVNARALQSTMVKQSAVSALQAMRDASKTGGAVGGVSEKEWPILEQQLAALGAAQTPTAYRAALTNLTNQLSSSSTRVKNAYEQTYGKLKYEATPYQQQGQTSSGQIAPAGAVRRVR